jgi:hypothetical protein
MMNNLNEYPSGYQGRKKYVQVRGFEHFVAACYTYKGADGRNYVRPEFGGDLSGFSGFSTEVAAHIIMRDIGEYTSPLDNSRITTRSQHREHMRIHGVIEVGNEMPQRPSSSKVSTNEETARFLKSHLDKVAKMPERQYQEHVVAQQAQLTENTADFGE